MNYQNSHPIKKFKIQLTAYLDAKDEAGRRTISLKPSTPLFLPFSPNYFLVPKQTNDQKHIACHRGLPLGTDYAKGERNTHIVDQLSSDFHL